MRHLAEVEIEASEKLDLHAKLPRYTHQSVPCLHLPVGVCVCVCVCELCWYEDRCVEICVVRARVLYAIVSPPQWNLALQIFG